MKLNIAYIGCGKISKKHFFVYNNYFNKKLNLVAVCDKKIETANKFVENLNQKINVYSNDVEMFNKEKIDIAIIMTRSGDHYKNVDTALNYVNNIVVEKPISLKYRDAILLYKKSLKLKKKIFVVLQNRYNLPIVALKQMIDKKKLGKIVLSSVRVRWKRDQLYYNQAKWRGTWRYDGGALTNQGIHHLDLIQWLIGPIKSVFAYSRKALANIEAEDTAVCLIKFKDDSICSFEVTTAARPNDLEGSISILTEKGSLEIGGFAANKLNYINIPDLSTKKFLKKFEKNPKSKIAFNLSRFYENIIDEILNKKKNGIKIKNALSSLKLLHALYMSLENKREVYLNEIISSKKLGY